MPKVAIYEDSQTILSDDEIRTPQNVASVETEAHAACVERSPQL